MTDTKQRFWRTLSPNNPCMRYKDNERHTAMHGCDDRVAISAGRKATKRIRRAMEKRDADR